MEGTLEVQTLEAPQPATPFEAYVIRMLGQLGQLRQLGPLRLDVNELKTSVSQLQTDVALLKPLIHSMDDLIESVKFIADRMFTKEEAEDMETRLATKKELAASEYRIKTYIDKAVGIQRDDLLKEDKKVDCVIDILVEETIIPTQDVRQLKNYGPFPVAA